MGSEDGISEGAPVDPYAQHVDIMTPRTRELQWERLSMDLVGLTGREVSGQLTPDEIEDTNHLRGIAGALFRKLGKTDVLQAAGLGLVDCVPDEEWDAMTTATHVGDERIQAIKYFNEKRKNAKFQPGVGQSRLFDK